ncbi:hypothetical protein [Jiangella mangrovi]|uniref:Glycosyltransferase family 1 protein n=1 Tax=Jiangella mangrovi TaxID=1524084 RepID=A0A7W9GR02_9ACTN|nr:hypothetical protein [Jiangella mangrovi]MBB5788404.1 hypothetical protein [Jiangella mangrovi]
MRDAAVLRPVKALYRQARRTVERYRPLAEPPVFPPVPATPVRLLAGPANFAGQAWAWARAAEAHLDGVGAVVFAQQRDRLPFPSDYSVPRTVYRHPYWQARQREYVTGGFTHVLIDAMRPVLGPRTKEDCASELPVLRRAGLSVALLAHGSDVRLPSRHAEREPWSPFTEPDELTEKLERQARRLGAIINGHDGPTFVSTPDLLADVPRARWLPVVVDPDRWATDAPVGAGRKLVVLHVPSNPRFKGSHHVDAAMTALADRGVVEYRRLEGIEPHRMPEVVAGVDVVLEQFVLGPYSVTACEAMAAGRVVAAYVAPAVREHVRQATGWELPVVQADPDTLADVVAGLAADRAALPELGELGRRFVREVHDGRLSAQVLAPWLGVA